jgi:DNA-binding transcriptional MerR regulator
MATYSIKDLENFTGIKAHTIRIWEKRYNVVEPKRTDTNIRYYDDEDLKKLLNVSILNRHGYKISNIVNFSDKALNEKIINLAQTQNDVESQIESLVLAMIDMDEHKFDKVFNTAVINMGFEETMLQVIYPFFQKIGVLWLIGTINPSQEHFISNLLRQKLLVAIDGLVQTTTEKTKTFVLYLPEGEHHELGLLFYYYLVKKANHKVYYLGESVPMEALEELSNAKKVNFYVTALVTAVHNGEVSSYLDSLTSNFKDSIFYLTGLQTRSLNFNIPSNCKVIESAISFKNELARM